MTAPLPRCQPDIDDAAPRRCIERQDGVLAGAKPRYRVPARHTVGVTE